MSRAFVTERDGDAGGDMGLTVVAIEYVPDPSAG